MAIFFNNNQRPINPERGFTERIRDFFRPKIESPVPEDEDPNTFFSRVKELFKPNVKSPVSGTELPGFKAPEPEPLTTPSPTPAAMPLPTPVPSPVPKKPLARNPNISKYQITDSVSQAIDKAAGKFNMPAELLYDIALKESSFDHTLVNKTPEGIKAGYPTGLFQFTDGTWEVIKKFNNDPDSALYKALPNLDRKDPVTNSLAAAYLISHGQLGRWDASKTDEGEVGENTWGQFYSEEELKPYYVQTLSYNQ